MAGWALGLMVLYLALAFGVRVGVALRTTGKSGLVRPGVGAADRAGRRRPLLHRGAAGRDQPGAGAGRRDPGLGRARHPGRPRGGPRLLRGRHRRHLRRPDGDGRLLAHRRRPRGAHRTGHRWPLRLLPQPDLHLHGDRLGRFRAARPDLDRPRRGGAAGLGHRDPGPPGRRAAHDPHPRRGLPAPGPAASAASCRAWGGCSSPTQPERPAASFLAPCLRFLAFFLRVLAAFAAAARRSSSSAIRVLDPRGGCPQVLDGALGGPGPV